MQAAEKWRRIESSKNSFLYKIEWRNWNLVRRVHICDITRLLRCYRLVLPIKFCLLVTISAPRHIFLNQNKKHLTQNCNPIVWCHALSSPTSTITWSSDLPKLKCKSSLEIPLYRELEEFSPVRDRVEQPKSRMQGSYMWYISPIVVLQVGIAYQILPGLGLLQCIRLRRKLLVKVYKKKDLVALYPLDRASYPMQQVTTHKEIFQAFRVDAEQRQQWTLNPFVVLPFL